MAKEIDRRIAFLDRYVVEFIKDDIGITLKVWNRYKAAEALITLEESID